MKNSAFFCADLTVNNASWRKVQNGVFKLDDDFYEKSGGILESSKHYFNLFV
jgi:hypothetical protein